jgi:peptidyl-dipeptidase Dcp
MNSDSTSRQNPLLKPFTTPYNAVPFDQIELSDYLPAYRAAFEAHDAEITAITANAEAPTFANTIEALEHSGALLDRLNNIFFNLLECCGTEEMQALAQELQPMLSEHEHNIALNEALFARIHAVYCTYFETPQETDAAVPLSAEQRRLLQQTHQSYVRSGALLMGADRETWREIGNEADGLTLHFSENILKATGAYELWLTEPADLAGLPDFVVESLRETAKERQKEGWVVTLKAPSYRPFMTYSARRDLRERLYRAYGSRSTAGSDFANDGVIYRLTELRLKKAQLLGYPHYAAYRLEPMMAKNEEQVMHLLRQLLEAYKPAAEREMEELRAYARGKEGADFELMPWDQLYYSNLLKSERYAIDDEVLKPYFPLPAVLEGIFSLAHKLYGLTFTEQPSVPKYHPEVVVYEVFDRDGSHLGLLYFDFYPRAEKQAGAWMTVFREQYRDEAGVDVRPHISIVTNFSRPTAMAPALLAHEEVNTLLHEFGHALHGLLTRCCYSSLSGTNVSRDFVELPSQFMENYLNCPEFLADFARHYQTGEPIPTEWIERLKAAQNFQAGYLCVRQLCFGFLDMAYHTITTPIHSDLVTFEHEATRETQLLEPVAGTMISPSFSHIFAGGYAAGYYGYKWAEVLDADAFSLFQEHGIYDPLTAAAFRHLLESGNTVEPELLYRTFRGRDPKIEALMRRDGILH